RELAGVDEAGVAFGTAHRHFHAGLQYLGGIAAADDGRNTEFACNDRRVAGAAAAVGDNGGGAFHHRFPVGVGHVGDQYIAGLHLFHLGDAADHANRAAADTLADRTALTQNLALLFQQVALHQRIRAAALHGFRARLHDVQLVVVAVFSPFDIHRALVVLLDRQRLQRERLDFGIGQTETLAQLVRHVDCFYRAAGLVAVGVNHLDGLGAEIAAQHRGPASLQRFLVYIEFVGIYRALHHGLAEAVRRSDEHNL